MKWLLSVAIGPVGRFIAAGRRSRDLWWGSTWLSECALAVAEALEALPATHPVQVELLVPSADRITLVKNDLARDAQYGHRVSNHLLLEVEAPDAAAVRALVAHLEQVARAELVRRLDDNWAATLARLGAQATSDADEVAGVLRADAFRAQRAAIADQGDLLELYAAWTPDTADRRVALERCAALMDARKAARTFAAPGWGDAGLRKSDLDPGRPSVLVASRLPDATPATAPGVRLARRRRVWLGVGPGEDLDAVGLARRIGRFRWGRDATPAPELGRLPFPPLSRVATDPWIARARACAPELLSALVTALKDAAKEEHFSVWCSAARDPDASPEQARAPGVFPFDASVLLEDGISALDAELGALAKDLSEPLADRMAQARAQLAQVAALLQPLHAHPELGLPPAYVALLAMDGDGVGNALHRALGRKNHPQLVKSLDEFARQAPEIIRRHHGCAFYAAGDELLAFLPVDTVLPCARALADAFAPVRAAAETADPEAEKTSLSGGVVIAHLKHDLRDLRAEVDDALSSAKGARRKAGPAGAVSWLEVRELPRSGVSRAACDRLVTLSEDLQRWSAGITADAISMRSAEKILDHRERFAWPPRERAADESKRNGGELGLELLRADLRAQTRRSGREGVEQLARRVEALQSWEDAEKLAAELMIARRVARVQSLRPVAASNPEEGAP